MHPVESHLPKVAKNPKTNAKTTNIDFGYSTIVFRQVCMIFSIFFLFLIHYNSNHSVNSSLTPIFSASYVFGQKIIFFLSAINMGKNNGN
ncbi:MAG: hypothetical protein Ct9H300mP4_12050 [Gammaproteobacteria bacterium]|nr:MAG: hypothetical protein Ct9H300mP4_12050 [Gammaproteobacteria bacterium]